MIRIETKGFTIVELTIVIAVVAILASAFVALFAPQINMYFYYPQSSRVNAAAADLLQVILEGDEKAKGLRYTGPPCAIGGGGGGGSTITTASTAGNTSTLTYNYVDSDYCGTGAAQISHTVTLVYDRSIGTVTRAIDGGSAVNIPYYVGTSSDIDFSVSGGGTDIFHYFDSSGTDMGAAPAVANIYRVDIDVIASSGSGQVKHNAGQIRLKSGVEIKRYTT
jgi:prepilin-type N-terminal cleavage/methylation domain-containing protein